MDKLKPALTLSKEPWKNAMKLMLISIHIFITDKFNSDQLHLTKPGYATA